MFKVKVSIRFRLGVRVLGDMASFSVRVRVRVTCLVYCLV